MDYIVLTLSEDGDVCLEKKSPEELLAELNSGDLDINDVASEIEGGDLMTAGSGTYIIKGELVVPRPKKVVKEYEL